MRTKKTIIILLCLICLSLFASSVQADEPAFELETDYPTLPIGEGSPEGGLLKYLQYINTLALSLVGIAAVGVLVIGGFLYMLSESVFDKEEGKNWIKGAISGLILALCYYLILNTINPDLVKLRIPGSRSPLSTSQESPADSSEEVEPRTLTPGHEEPEPETTETMEASVYLAQGILTEEAARSQLGDKIGVKDKCEGEQSVGCVKMEGVRETALEGLLALDNFAHIANFDVNLYITSATEGEHEDDCHIEGQCFDVVDLNLTDSRHPLSELINERVKNPAKRDEGHVIYFEYDTFGVPSPDGTKVYCISATREIYPNDKNRSHFHIEITPPPRDAKSC